jgi:hypothetical protein
VLMVLSLSVTTFQVRRMKEGSSLSHNKMKPNLALYSIVYCTGESDQFAELRVFLFAYTAALETLSCDVGLCTHER